MLVIKIGTAAAIMLMAVAGGGLCGTKKSAETDKMFPDGLEYDFGTVQRGTRVTHAFRIVNTTDSPLKISLRHH
jgi:hypothetical protein